MPTFLGYFDFVLDIFLHATMELSLVALKYPINSPPFNVTAFSDFRISLEIFIPFIDSAVPLTFKRGNVISATVGSLPSPLVRAISKVSLNC